MSGRVYVHVEKNHSGDYDHVVKFIGGGGIFYVAKFMGGGYVHVYKFGLGDFVRGDIVLHSRKKTTIGIRLYQNTGCDIFDAYT